MNIKITSKDGVKLLTKDKFCDDDINVTVDESLLGTPEVEYPNETVKIYKETRNKNYPILPLPHEIENEKDVIYMLYDASDDYCCPAFNITFTECVCTIQKYNNTTLISEYVESVTSATAKYLQFSKEDTDYSQYNFIVIKLRGNITFHNCGIKSKFNGSIVAETKLLEISGKCNSCRISIKVSSTEILHTMLEHYSFLGTNNTQFDRTFWDSTYLKTLILDTSKSDYLYGICYGCINLKSFYFTDTSRVKNMMSAFERCYSIDSISLTNIKLVENLYSAFEQCISLKKLFLGENVSTNMNYLLSKSRILESISLENNDASKIENLNNAFQELYLLKEFPFKNISVSFQLNDCYSLAKKELVNILNNLATVETTQTLTLGSTLLAKLTEEEKAIATSKGWTLA